MNCFQEVIIKNGKNYILVDFKRDSLTAARKSGGKRTIFYIKVEKVHDHESAEAAASVFENLVHGSGAFRQEREARVSFEPFFGPVLTSGSLAFTPDRAGKGMTRPRVAVVVEGQEGAA